MCGINGIIDLKRSWSQGKLRSLVHRMNEQIIYRGPDDEGIYISDNLAMGMRRLSIIDLSTGNQPIHNEDNNLTIVFNGEIYNFKELKKQLRGKHTFYTDSDTEVIIHAYEEWGAEAFKKLDGMFALSIYDKKAESVILVRDRVGEKPLYYYSNENIFLWASELKSLLITGLIKKDINKRALNQFLQFSYIPAPLSILEGIYKLLPGHFLKISTNGSTEEGIYWSLKDVSDQNIPYEEAEKKLLKFVKESVKRRMISDVPFGAFLSGGIDSASIVAIMSRVCKEPIETFTIGYMEKEYDERDRARLVAEKYHTSHHEYVLSADDILKSIDEVLGKLDEPFADPSILPSWFVSKFASQYVKVVLTGDAGDELFLGYDKYLIDYYADKYNRLHGIVRKAVEKSVAVLPDTSALSRKARKVVRNATQSPFERRLDLMSRCFKGNERQYLLNEAYYDDKSTEIVRERYQELSEATDMKRTQYIDILTVLEGNMLPKMDRAAMYNSIETRVPLLSPDILEMAFGLPDEYKLQGKNKKRIMKDTFRRLLPEKFDQFPKSGFGVPLDRWFRNELKGNVEKVLNEKSIKEQGIFNYSYIRKILDDHYAERNNNGDRIWALFVFQKWYERFVVNDAG